MPLKNVQQIEMELQQIRALIAAIALHQNTRIELLEEWTEKEASKRGGIFGELGNDGPAAGYRIPFAPIRKRMARIQHYFMTKLAKRKGYEELAEEYTKDGKSSFIKFQ